MAEKANTEVFLPLKLKTYKESKVKLLKTKLLGISSQDRIKRLSDLKRLKQEQRRKIKKVIREIKQNQAKIKKDLPSEKEVKIKGKPIVINTQTTKAEPRIAMRPASKIDQELAKIQEKIRNLNL